MANLAITARCNRDCTYCFAMETLERAKIDDSAMSLETIDRSLDFIQRSGQDQVRILGGEPTIHPEFPEIVERILARGLRLLVFSGGLVPERAQKCIEKIPPGRVSVLVNVAMPGEAPPVEVERQAALFRRLGARVALGINIPSPAVEPMFLLDWIEEYGLAKMVRLGIAHPILGGSNEYLHPRHYKEVGRRIAEFGRAARQAGVRLEFDCGWVPCMFPPGAMRELGLGPNEVGLRCSPILDVLPDGQVISCFPLADHHREPLPAEHDARWLREQFEERQRRDRQVFLFQECATCDWRLRGECTGGCLAGSLRRVRKGSFTLEEKAEGGRMKDESEVGESRVLDTKVRLSHLLPILNLSDVSPIPKSQIPNPKSHFTLADLRAVEYAPPPRRPSVDPSKNLWAIPYIDQPLEFWERVREEYGPFVREVYFPLPGDLIGSGRPPQPDSHTAEFLRSSRLPRGVLLNAVTLPKPVADIAPEIVESLKRLIGDYGLDGATVTDLLLARRIKEAVPDLPLTASVLMEVSEPFQAARLNGLCDTLVPASRAVRDLPALEGIRRAFRGRIRLLVNESCLPGCVHRTQHFHEMALGISRPRSLCAETLSDEPWLRLTGSWVLPQHLHLYGAVCDEFKLAGRVTLRHPADYFRVVGSYLYGRPLTPDAIGGGPSSVLTSIDVDEAWFAYTLKCGRKCHECTVCPELFDEAASRVPADSRDLGFGIWDLGNSKESIETTQV